MSSRLVPPAPCCLTAPVRARGAWPDRPASSFSSALICATRGRYPLIRRSFEEPNSLRASAIAIAQVRIKSLEIEADRYGQIDMIARQFARWRREGLRPAQQRQRLCIERVRARRAHNATFEHTTLPVEAEEHLGHPLLAAGLCRLRIALVALQQRHDLRLPRRHHIRVGGND